MRIFVAGATGVLGRRVTRKLLGKGHHVVGLSRSNENAQLLVGLGAEPRMGNLFSNDEVRNLSSDCEAILHLATAIPTKSKATRKDWMLNDRIRREGTASLVAAAVRNNCRLYVQQSVTFLYGDHLGEWVDEKTEISPRQPPVLQSAADMEQLVFSAAVQQGLPAVILRFGSFYAHDSAQTSSMFSAIQNGKFPVIGDGQVYWNMITVDDAADAVISAVEKSGIRPGTVFNICDNEPALYHDIVHFTATALGARKPRSLPAFVAKLAIGGDLVKLLLSSVRCRNAKAREEMGWIPKHGSFRDGITAEIAKWRSGKSA